MSASEGATRVRFAPSPTGYFHIGGARTALYNWLFARQTGGTFVLRIEDTDRERSEESWTKGILDALTWIGVAWDEGPIMQSARGALYRAAVDQLVATGHLYACDCSRDDIDARTRHNAVPGYDGYCRERGVEPVAGLPLRFRVPDEGTTVVNDLVRGDVEFENATIEDFIVVKSNGDPLFVLANVVDDRDMAITHVIRGEEHLPTTPKAILIWRALGGMELPHYAHLALLVNEKRQKLSKRRDRVAVEDYRALGFLPEPLVNYLALLGWSPGDDRELFTLDELVVAFNLAEVSHSPAFFDEKRLTHFNGLYIRAMRTEEFIERTASFLSETDLLPEGFDAPTFERVAPLVQERVAILSEIPGLVDFLFNPTFVVDDAAFEKSIRRDEHAPEILGQAAARFSECEWNSDTIRAVVVAIADSLGRNLARTQAPIRVATMGRAVGLPLFESLEVLGRERTIERISRSLSDLATGE